MEYGCNQVPTVIPITVKHSDEYNLYSMSVRLFRAYKLQSILTLFPPIVRHGIFNPSRRRIVQSVFPRMSELQGQGFIQFGIWCKFIGFRLAVILKFSFSFPNQVDIEENNQGNYLSAGEMPLPALYSMMSLLFFLSGLFWVFILKKSEYVTRPLHHKFNARE